jgi:hypothetical protein
MNNTTQQPDPEEEPDPDARPDATRVARRSLVLAAVVCRGSIEHGVGHPEAEAVYSRLLDWLTRIDLWDEVEPSEMKILQKPLGALEQEEVNQTTWDMEGLAILAWALHQIELPSHDQKVDPYDLVDLVGFLSEDAEELIRTARLQTLTELEACRELMYAIDARLSDFIRHRKKKDITHWVDLTWLAALGLDATDLIVDGDLAIDGKAISEVEFSRVRECSSIIYGRHQAIIWLVEGYPLYSETPVDT